MPLAFPFEFDWKEPDYEAVFAYRAESLEWIRQHPECLPGLKDYYREHPAQFIIDWGVTSDPRNIEIGRPALIPFLLFPRQEEWIDYLLDRWRNREPGLSDKSRDGGLSWIAMALSCTLCLFIPGMVVGVGSRKEDLVDHIADPHCLFHKARVFMENLPLEFRGGWDRAKHSPHMRISFPQSGSSIIGESGDNIGRGGRTGLYFVDEAAHLERPLIVDDALSQTTNSRQDISTPNGLANPFAEKRFSGRIKCFPMHWRQDPRKDQAWYDKQVATYPARTVAQEIDINYSASVEGVLIPSAWVQAAVGAFAKLGIASTGRRSVGLDVADEGVDLCAAAAKQGAELVAVDSWSGKGSDIFRTTQRAFGFCEEQDALFLYYDADGLGAGVRGDARIINEGRRERGEDEIPCEPFRGSAGVHDPDGDMEPKAKRKNKDRFENFKAQAWWSLRHRFLLTYRAVVEGMAYNPDDLISIDPGIAKLAELMTELSQPTWDLNKAGKIMITKTPDGMRSPNHADAVMIAYQPGARSIEVWAALGNAA